LKVIILTFCFVIFHRLLADHVSFFSALEVFLNDVRYINSRFAYLLTDLLYWFACWGVMQHMMRLIERLADRDWLSYRCWIRNVSGTLLRSAHYYQFILHRSLHDCHFVDALTTVAVITEIHMQCTHLFWLVFAPLPPLLE